MLKKRLIAVLPVKNDIVVQSIGFNKYLPVGKPRIAVEYLNNWGIDEIILLDIEASKKGTRLSSELVREVSRYTQSPLTVGGGISNTEDMKDLISSGADKVVINTAALKDRTLITRGAEIFGNQCIIVSVDIKKNRDKYEVHTKFKENVVDPFEYIKTLEDLGAGELFINSVERDGAKSGYDLDLAEKVSRITNLPVIICGGVGHPHHFVEGLKLPKVSAVSAGNFFHFQEHSAILAKRYITEYLDAAVRLDSYSTYKESILDAVGRLQKKTDEDLESQFFEFHPKEVI